MGFSLSAVHIIFGVSFVIILEIVVASVIPTFLDIEDSYDEMIDRSQNEMLSKIQITDIKFDSGEGIVGNDSVDSNSSDIDSSPDKGTETVFPNAQAVTTDSNVMTIQEEQTADITEHDDDVDNNSSDVDSSTDKGTETDFTNAQDNTTDSNVMIIQENQTNDLTDHKVAVQSNSCDVDSSADKGSEITSFDNCKETAPDTDVMTIQESDQGTPAVNENKVVDGFTSTWTAWTENGASPPYLDASDNVNNIFESTTDLADEGWFTFQDTTATGSGFTVVMYIEFDSTGDEVLNWYIDTTGDNTQEFSGTIANGGTSGLKNTGTISGLDTALEINAARLWCEYDFTGSSNDMQLDYAYLNIQRAAAPNYCIDFEYQWTSAIVGDENEQVCMYLTARTGTETLGIKYWTGSLPWVWLGNITGTGWVNVSAVGLSGVPYTIQFIGATESSDAEQGSWSIDCLFLHTWNSTNNYQIDFEYQWTSAIVGDENEQVCMYLTARTGTETLGIKYRTSVPDWAWLGNITGTGWVNVTAVGLSGVPYTIQFIGATESGDTSQGSWSIDCLFLHTYNNSNYQIDFEYDWSNADFDKDNEKVCIYLTSVPVTEDLNVKYWSGASWTSIGQITNTGWTNLTAAGLTSQEYVIQLVGTSESGDTNQDNWDIDCIFLRTWNDVTGNTCNITVENLGDIRLKTDDFDILIDGVLKSFNCQKEFIDLNDEADFSIETTIENGAIIKVTASNGVSDYEKYIE